MGLRTSAIKIHKTPSVLFGCHSNSPVKIQPLDFKYFST